MEKSRIHIELPVELKRKAHSLLVGRGTNLSEWIREQLEALVTEKSAEEKERSRRFMSLETAPPELEDEGPEMGDNGPIRWREDE